MPVLARLNVQAQDMMVVLSILLSNCGDARTVGNIRPFCQELEVASCKLLLVNYAIPMLPGVCTLTNSTLSS